MKLNIKQMNYEEAYEISKWIYQEPYSIYSNDGSDSCITELSHCIPSTYSVEKEIEASELSAAQDDRVLFLRRYWFGESLKSLAEECATTPNRLAGRMYRLREKLKLTLDKEGIYL